MKFIRTRRLGVQKLILEYLSIYLKVLECCENKTQDRLAFRCVMCLQGIWPSHRKACVPGSLNNETIGQPVHLFSTMGLVVSFMKSLKSNEAPCIQQRLRQGCAWEHTDLSFKTYLPVVKLTLVQRPSATPNRTSKSMIIFFSCFSVEFIPNSKFCRRVFNSVDS